MRMKPAFNDFLSGIKAGDINLLGQCITLVESRNEADGELANRIIEELMPYTGKSVRIGITGAPGVGKSTFISQFGKIVLKHNRKLAVLAIDPSSSKSGGSIMGDKTRMSGLLQSRHVYVRPSPAGETLGGVARKTREVMMLCEAAGFNYIVIETVGTGQSEITVKNMVDYLLLLLPPLGGDELQGIKKGIVELADGIAITKSDGDNREAAEMAAAEYRSALGLVGKEIMVQLTSAQEGFGLEDTFNAIETSLHAAQNDDAFQSNREQQLIGWMHQELKHQLFSRFYGSKQNQQQIAALESRIQRKEVSPLGAVREILQKPR